MTVESVTMPTPQQTFGERFQIKRRSIYGSVHAARMTTLEQKIDRLQASVDALAKILAAHSPAPALGLVAVYERERDRALVKTLTARKTRTKRV